MRRKTNRLVAAGLLAASLVILGNSATAQTEQLEKEVQVVVDATHAWPDCKLDFLLKNRFVEYNFLKVVDNELVAELSNHAKGSLPRAELTRLGKETGCRFIVWCVIDKEELVRENHFSIPLIAKQRRVKAQLKGRYYVLDCERDRIVRKGVVDFESHGPSSLQLVDFGDADPALLVSYQDRLELFGDLETRAAEQIEEDFLEISKLR